MNHSMPGLPVHHHLLEFIQTHIHWVSHLILCCPLLILPPIPSSIRVFSNESTLHMRWPKYWSFSFSIIPSKEHPGLISFRTDWLDLLAVQGTHKSLLHHHSSRASNLQCSAFFTVQLSHPYMTTGKTIALTRWTFVGKAISLLFNMLSRLVITFLPRSKHPSFYFLKLIVRIYFNIPPNMWRNTTQPTVMCIYDTVLQIHSKLLERKAMTNLESILKSRDTTLPTKFCLVKAMVLQ